MTNTLSRRAVLGAAPAAALAIAVPSLAVAARVPGATPPAAGQMQSMAELDALCGSIADQKLIRSAERFWSLRAELDRQNEVYFELAEAVDFTVEGSSPADDDWWERLKAAQLANGTEEAAQRINRLCSELDKISEAMASTPANSIAGLRAKLAIVDWEFDFCEPSSAEDSAARKAVRSIVEDIERMAAGVTVDRDVQAALARGEAEMAGFVEQAAANGGELTVRGADGEVRMVIKTAAAA